MIIETNPCEDCDFSPAVCDGDIAICQMTLGNTRLISEEDYEKKKLDYASKMDNPNYCRDLTIPPTIIEADKTEDLDNLDSMLEHLWNATVEDHRKYSEDMESEEKE